MMLAYSALLCSDELSRSQTDTSSGDQEVECDAQPSISKSIKTLRTAAEERNEKIINGSAAVDEHCNFRRSVLTRFL